MEWSKVVQPPQYLSATRQSYLNIEFSALVAQHCGVFNGSNVLEVGCGNGCFSKYLSREVSNVTFAGLDRDTILLSNGEKVYGNNSIAYVEGSAFELPFNDNEFDAVYSHTFFNCVNLPNMAMGEMKRVVKNGCPITSVTSMSLQYEAWYPGDYPYECKWNDTIPRLMKEMVVALKKLSLDPYSLNCGISTSYMPVFFSKSDLKDISIFPVSRAFSLSDASIDIHDKRQYIENLYVGECARIQGAMEYDGFLAFFSKEKCNEYMRELKERHDFWLDHLDDNKIWDWFGSSSLLVSGYCKK